MAAAGGAFLGSSSGEAAAPPGGVPKPARALGLVAQAYVAWLARSLRYLARAGTTSAGYARVLAWQLGAIAFGQGHDGVRVLIDESVAHLRECGDLTVQEALALQKLLRELGEALRDLEAETLEEPRRYAKAKP